MSLGVKQDRLSSGYVVSTIWRDSANMMVDDALASAMKLLGITPEEMGADLGEEGDFETMVFTEEQWDGSGALQHVDFRRYSTEEEALKGHEELCRKWSEKMSETIGERIKRIRNDRGLSQREIECDGVTFAYLSRIEAGERMPSEKALRQIATKLDVTPHELEQGSKTGICPHCLKDVER